GRTSVTVKVEVFAERHHAQGEYVKVTEANFTYVAIDGNGRPTPIVKRGKAAGSHFREIRLPLLHERREGLARRRLAQHAAEALALLAAALGHRRRLDPLL